MTVNFKVDEASVREFFDNLDSETLLMNIDRLLKEQQDSRVKYNQNGKVFWSKMIDHLLDKVLEYK